MPRPRFVYFILENPIPPNMRAGEETVVHVLLAAQSFGEDSERRILLRPGLQLLVDGVGDNWVRGGLLQPISVAEVPDVDTVELRLTPPEVGEGGVLRIGVLAPGSSPVWLAEQAVTVLGGHPAGEVMAEREALLGVNASEAAPIPVASLFIAADPLTWTFVLTVGKDHKVKESIPAWADVKTMSAEALFSQDTIDRPTLVGNGYLIATSLPRVILDTLAAHVHAGDILEINDQTSAEIPWELAYLHVADRHGFLGEFFGVARAVQPYADGAAPQLEVAAMPSPLMEVVQIGRVAAYVSKASDLPNTDPERAALDNLGVRCAEWREELLDALEQHDVGTALVYIASHAEFDDSPATAARLVLTQGEVISAEELLGHDLRLLRASHPLVFVNACHSARMRPKGAWRRFGLPATFLAKRACGYLGAMGRINVVNAGVFGHLFLTAVHGESGAYVADVLRRLRSEARAYTGNHAVPDPETYFLNAFMYVYYGPPLLRLQLVGAPVPEVIDG
jgi:hypothetical protein